MSAAETIMDVAEARMRQLGFGAVSFRTIADEVGIKSASLHYHFPNKADLGARLVERYAERFAKRLAEAAPDNMDPAARLSAYVELYRAALGDDNTVCLCAMLGSEIMRLPDAVAEAVREFVQTQLAWLRGVYVELDDAKPDRHAHATLAALQGGMILSGVLANEAAFEAAALNVLTN